MNKIKTVMTKIKCLLCGVSYESGGWIHPLSELKQYKNGKIVLEDNVIIHKGVRIDTTGEVFLEQEPV